MKKRKKGKGEKENPYAKSEKGKKKRG